MIVAALCNEHCNNLIVIHNVECKRSLSIAESVQSLCTTQCWADRLTQTLCGNTVLKAIYINSSFQFVTKQWKWDTFQKKQKLFGSTFWELYQKSISSWLFNFGLSHQLWMCSMYTIQPIVYCMYTIFASMYTVCTCMYTVYTVYTIYSIQCTQCTCTQYVHSICNNCMYTIQPILAPWWPWQRWNLVSLTKVISLKPMTLVSFLTLLFIHIKKYDIPKNSPHYKQHNINVTKTKKN